MTKPFSEEQKQQWKENILKQQKSGLSIARWCRENNLAVHNYFYWRKKIIPKFPLTRSDFIELAEETSITGITIEYKNIRVHIDKQFSASALKTCLEVIKEIKCKQ